MRVVLFAQAEHIVKHLTIFRQMSQARSKHLCNVYLKWQRFTQHL